MHVLMGILNIVVLQWLGLRLTTNKQEVITKAKLVGASLMHDGSISTDKRVEEWEEHTWYSFKYWVLPLSGWLGYPYIGGDNYFRISKKYITIHN